MNLRLRIQYAKISETLVWLGYDTLQVFGVGLIGMVIVLAFTLKFSWDKALEENDKKFIEKTCPEGWWGGNSPLQL